MKKNFTGGLNTLLGEKQEATGTKKRGRPQSNFKEVTKTSQKGTKEKETRATFVINEELLEQVKTIAYWDRVLIKDVLNRALIVEIEKYIKKNGELKQIPKK